MTHTYLDKKYPLKQGYSFYFYGFEFYRNFLIKQIKHDKTIVPKEKRHIINLAHVFPWISYTYQKQSFSIHYL